MDLDFAGPDRWRLVVELKFGSGFGAEQLERYAAETPVAAIVRDATKVPDLKGHSNWVGAATWLSLVDDLRRLPVADRFAADWQGLLEVVMLDGDFDVVPPAGVPETVATVELLTPLAPLLLAHFKNELRRVHRSESAVSLDRLRHGKVTGRTGPWAGFSVGTPGEQWLWIGVRNLWSRAPRLAVWLTPYPDSWAKHKLKAAHARIERHHDFRQRPPDAYVFEQPMEQLARSSDEVFAVIAAKLTDLVDSRVFEIDVKRQARKYG